MYFIETQILPRLFPGEVAEIHDVLANLPAEIENRTFQHQARQPAFSEFTDDMTPDAFEHYCAQQLRQAGWAARVTMRSRDQGVDVVADKAGRRVVLQCKFYSSPVGNKAVQEIAAGRVHEMAQHAAVVTNNRYTAAAEQLAQTNNVLLLHHTDLPRLEELLTPRAA